MLVNKHPRIALVGATGAVGQELLRLLREREFPFSDLALVASSRSAGSSVGFMGKKYIVQNLKTFDFTGYDLAFFSAGTETSKEWARKAAHQGALVIDNTNAFRMDSETPLVVPQVNPEVLASRPKSGIVANPNCSTIQMVRVLKPLSDKFGLEDVVVSTYQAASGGGKTGMEDLKEDSINVCLGAQEISKKPSRFPVPLAFNVVPQVDVFQENGFTLEEQKMLQETRKILSIPTLKLTATAVRVPVVNGHSEAIYLQTKASMERQEVIAVLKSSPELSVYDGVNYPTPRFLASNSEVHVGRIRLNPENDRGLWCWIVADNLTIGAALNAVQIAELVVRSNQGEAKDENAA